MLEYVIIDGTDYMPFKICNFKTLLKKHIIISQLNLSKWKADGSVKIASLQEVLVLAEVQYKLSIMQELNDLCKNTYIGHKKDY